MSQSLDDILYEDELPEEYTPDEYPLWIQTTKGRVTEYTIDGYAEFQFYGAYLQDRAYTDAWISSDLFYSFEQCR